MSDSYPYLTSSQWKPLLHSGKQKLAVWLTGAAHMGHGWGGGVAVVVTNQGALTPPREQWLARLDVGDGWVKSVAMSMLCVKKPLASQLVAAVVWVLLVRTLWVPHLRAPDTPLHLSYSR